MPGWHPVGFRNGPGAKSLLPFPVINPFTIFEIMLRQDNLHTKMESAVTVFKGLAKKLKRNYNKQKSNIDKYRAEQLKIMSEQQQYIIDLYSHIGQTIQF